MLFIDEHTSTLIWQLYLSDKYGEYGTTYELFNTFPP